MPYVYQRVDGGEKKEVGAVYLTAQYEQLCIGRPVLAGSPMWLDLIIIREFESEQNSADAPDDPSPPKNLPVLA